MNMLQNKSGHRFQPLETKKSHWGKYLLVFLGVLVIIGIVGFMFALSSLESTRERAREAAARQTLHAALPSVIICAESGYTVVAPRDGGDMCVGSDYSEKWADISNYGATWGGCEFYLNLTEDSFHVQYCAVLQNNMVYKCTENGCAFDLPEKQV